MTESRGLTRRALAPTSATQPWDRTYPPITLKTPRTGLSGAAFSVELFDAHPGWDGDDPAGPVPAGNARAPIVG
jgi:hypothetical protein